MSASHQLDALEETLAIGDAQKLLTEHLPLVRRTVELACGRGFAHEVEDCFAWVLVRLLENDYARVRRYRGDAPFRFYLRSVVIHLVRDYRVSVWGKWKSSVAARQLGWTALRLERLVWRDGHAADDAVAIVAQEDGLDPKELHRLLERIPARDARHRFVEESLAEAVEATGEVESRVQHSRQRALESDLKRHLKEILAQEDPAVRQLLRSHYRDGEKIVEIARREGFSERRYYSQLARTLKKIRRELLLRGIEESALEELRWQKLELSFTSLFGDTLSSDEV